MSASVMVGEVGFVGLVGEAGLVIAGVLSPHPATVSAAAAPIPAPRPDRNLRRETPFFKNSWIFSTCCLLLPVFAYGSVHWEYVETSTLDFVWQSFFFAAVVSIKKTALLCNPSSLSVRIHNKKR